MNQKYFRDAIEDFSLLSHRLTPEQSAYIENSLTILQNENKFRDIFFWGQIYGLENDYYIAFGYVNDCLRKRRFFWSHNCVNWIFLPPENPELRSILHLITTKFQGDPTWIEEIDLDPVFEYDNEEMEYKIVEQKTKRIKEEHRLAAVVAMITDESAVIPRGCLYKRVDHTVIYNPPFHGLTKTQANDLRNFQLYRRPKRENMKENLLKRKDYNYPTDFFDTLDSCELHDKCFSKVIEIQHNIVFIRSLQWLGMYFYHKLDTERHGFWYFGDGKKNLDLLFMHY